MTKAEAVKINLLITAFIPMPPRKSGSINEHGEFKWRSFLHAIRACSKAEADERIISDVMPQQCDRVTTEAGS
jgi:hypothetical protein